MRIHVVRVAIIGAGVSGLVVARLLHRAHAVTVFEAADHLGGHVHTVRVDTADATHHVDTGFIVYNERNYPAFTRLLRTLGVATQESTMSFSVRADRGRFEYSSAVPSGLFARPALAARPSFQRMIADYLRWKHAARRSLERHELAESMTVADFVRERRYSSSFIERMLIPLGASIWSANRARFLRFPARYALEFFNNHGLLNTRQKPEWRAITGGSARYVEALVQPFRECVRLASPVLSVTRHDNGVDVHTRSAGTERFDRVVIATHSDQALRMLADPTPRERALLGAFPYQTNDAVLHTDARLLPSRRRAWASWNYHLPDDPGSPVGVTYHMNRLQRLDADRQFCVTLNRAADVDDTAVLKRIGFAHPLYTSETLRAQREHDSLNGNNHTYYCGAYWGHGFHEDGVQSGLRVAARFGERLQ